MKTNLLLFISLLVLSCKNQTAETKTIIETKEITEQPKSKHTVYPEELIKIFDFHGGLETWNKMNTLSFTMGKKNGKEVTTVNLKNRKSLIEMPEHTLGFDGEHVWLKSNGNAEYEGNPRFYYNLMFYFYAMPFVLADDGIVYSETKPLTFQGKTYPGINISYNDGIGESPEDEYIIYYNPETYKMEWLAYTVTYFSKEKSKEFHFRKFSNWQEVNGLLLNQTMVSYKSENNQPTEPKKETHFTSVKVSKEKPEADMFDVPRGATIVE